MHILIHSYEDDKHNIVVCDPDTDSPRMFVEVSPTRDEAFNHRNAVFHYLNRIAAGGATEHHVLAAAPIPAGMGIRGWMTMVKVGA